MAFWIKTRLVNLQSVRRTILLSLWCTQNVTSSDFKDNIIMLPWMVYLSMSFHLPIYLSVYLMYLFVCTFLFLFIRLSVRHRVHTVRVCWYQNYFIYLELDNIRRSTLNIFPWISFVIMMDQLSYNKRLRGGFCWWWHHDDERF